MRKIIYLMVLMCYSSICLAQKNIMEYIPILIEDSIKKPVIYDENLTDSFKVLYIVVADFRYPFEDTSKDIIVRSVSLNRISITHFTDKPTMRNAIFAYDKQTLFQKRIWEICAKKFSKWYKYQPYEKYPYRTTLQNRVSFGGLVYLKPKKKDIL